MSESHELYKKYLANKENTNKARGRQSKYIDDYEREEFISKYEWKEKDREEREDFDRANRLFGNIY